jgi:ParB-like chromosome segregation protein Spo0J/N6-adenosine-specific RNA methylase IME4
MKKTKKFYRQPPRTEEQKAASRRVMGESAKKMLEAGGAIDPHSIIIPDRLRALREDGLAELIASFAELGQLNPIIVRPKKGGGYVLVAGRRRLEAARRSDWKVIKCAVRDDLNADKAELAEIDENLMRAELTPAERALHIERRKKLYEKVHPEIKHGGDRKSAKAKSSRQVGDLNRFTEDTASKTGQSERSVQRDANRGENVAVLPDIVGTSLDAGAELDALAKLPESEQRKLAKRAKAGERVSAKTRLKQVKRSDRERELGAKQLALPTKKYGVVVADDGWRDEVWSEETGTDRNPNYTVLDSNDAQRIVAATADVFNAVCADDCVLGMWTTIQHLAIAIAVLQLRGFEYKSHYIWKKSHIGLGRWVRSQHEVFLIGTRGDVVCPAPGTQWGSIIEAEPAVKGLHSSKPDRFLEMIETYYPTIPKIELNRRGPPRQGWDAWGNEAPVLSPATNTTAGTAPTRSTGNDVATEASAEARRAFYAGDAK